MPFLTFQSNTIIHIGIVKARKETSKILTKQYPKAATLYSTQSHTNTHINITIPIQDKNIKKKKIQNFSYHTQSYKHPLKDPIFHIPQFKQQNQYLVSITKTLKTHVTYIEQNYIKKPRSKNTGLGLKIQP